MSRVLVTGAAGFIGCHVAAALARRGHDVHGVDDYSGGSNEPEGAVMHECDLAFDQGRLQSLCSSLLRPEILVHCAANAREGESFYSPVKITASNLMAYSATLRSCVEAGSLRRVVLFSSMAVYGEGEPPFSEDDAPKPVDHYGWNKLAMEGTTRSLSPVHGFDFVILRPHNVFGPLQRLGDKFRNVVGIFCNQVLRGEPITIYGDGSQVRAFSYIDDSLPCYVRAAEGAASGEIVNVGGAEPTTVGDLAQAVTEALGQPGHPIVRLPARHGEVQSAWTTCNKACTLLGYEERVGWRKGVRAMAEWARGVGYQEWNDGEGVELPSGKALPGHWRAK